MPTYNRKEKALKQVSNIIDQCENIPLGEVEFLISDNCSDDNTSHFLEDNLNFIPSYVILKRQQANLGLVGNLYFLYNNSKGKYVWFISDDDIVCQASIKSVLNLIETKKSSFFLLNFSLEVNGEIKDKYWLECRDYINLFSDDKWGGLGLLSIQVLNREYFKSIYFNNFESNNLCQPITISLYGLFFIDGYVDFSRSYVTHHVGNYSWEKNTLKVYSLYLFRAVVVLKKYSSNRDKYKAVYESLLRIENFSISSVKYLLKNIDITYLYMLIKNRALKTIVKVYFRNLLNKKR